MRHAHAALSGAAQARPFLVLHSSDDMYGADRMLLEVIAAMPEDARRRVLVWLPSDYGHPELPLCERLTELRVAWEHVDLPVVRRRYLNPRGGMELARRAAATRRRIAAADPAEVLLATSAVLPVAPLLPRRSRVRVHLHMQEVWQGREARVLGRLAGRVDCVIAISEAARSSLPDTLRSRAVVVPNATSEPAFTTPLASRGEELTFVAAGRWTPGKGYGVLIDAWDSAGCPGELVILGGPPSMGAGVDVRGMVRASRCPESIRVVGEVRDVSPFIDEADVMVVPSTTPEGFGLVTIEAFAHGRPVVASACGGSLEIVRDGCGWLVAPGDASHLASILAGLTRDSVVEAGSSARRRYEERYSREAFRGAMRAALDHPAGEQAFAGLPPERRQSNSPVAERTGGGVIPTAPKA